MSAYVISSCEKKIYILKSGVFKFSITTNKSLQQYSKLMHIFESHACLQIYTLG